MNVQPQIFLSLPAWDRVSHEVWANEIRHAELRFHRLFSGPLCSVVLHC
jgi:hypothetical protein